MEAAAEVSGGHARSDEGFPRTRRTGLWVINKIDRANVAGVDLATVERDLQRMWGAGPYVLAQVKRGVGVDAIAANILQAWRQAISLADIP